MTEKETGKVTEKKMQSVLLGIYISALLLIIGTPFLGGILAPLLDWAAYGALRGFFKELFTACLWLLEIMIMDFYCRKRFKKSILCNEETKGEELSLQRIAIISVVTAMCILVVSLQIRFQVKPFYDLGEKFNGYELLNHVGVLVRNIIKCIWIVIMLGSMQSLIECRWQLRHQNAGDKKEVKWNNTPRNIPYTGLVLMGTMGLWDIVTAANTLALTYTIFYGVYAALYLLTDKSMFKTYLLVMFIYLF